MTRVKICGIQRLDHALVAAEAGADFIGLVFVPGRHRRLDVDAATAIVSGVKALGNDAPKVVGLFADQTLEEVNGTVRACGLDLVQLCGKESVDYSKHVEVSVIKVLHISNPPNPPLRKGSQAAVPPYDKEPALSLPKGGSGGISSPTGQHGIGDLDIKRLAGQIRSYLDAGHLVTLDRLVDGLQGGTGQSFDWQIAAELSRQGSSFLLAGGLTPGNVAQAVTTVQPWGVDVSSGVETGGVKDPGKIRAFISHVRQIDT